MDKTLSQTWQTAAAAAGESQKPTARASLVSDSISSISRGFVVQQVVRLVVRLADCCMQLAVDLWWTCCATSCTTRCGLAVGFRYAVYLLYNVLLQQVVRQIHDKSK